MQKTISGYVQLIENESSYRTDYKNGFSYIYLLRALKHIFSGTNLISNVSERKINVSLKYLNYETHLSKNFGDLRFHHLESFKIRNNRRIFLILVFFKIFFYGFFTFKIKSSLIFFLSLCFFEKLNDYKKTINFIYYSELPEIYGLSLLMNNSTTGFNYLELANFLTRGSAIQCNKFITLFDFIADYAKDCDFIKASKYEHIISTQDIKNKSQSFSCVDRKSKVFYYTSGYYSRLIIGSHAKQFLIDNMNREYTAIERLSYLTNKLNTELILMPHYARNVESVERANEYYSIFLDKYKNVKLSQDSSKYIQNDYDLSVTYGSNVFFDQLYLGRKSIIIDGVPKLADILQYEKIKPFFYESDKISENEFRDLILQSPLEFFNHKIDDFQNKDK